MQTGQQIKGRSIAMIMLGVLLSGGMLYLLFLVASIMRPEISRTTSRFTGSRSDAVLIFGILGTILVLGVTSIITGFWQVITGRANRVLTVATLALGLLAVALAMIFYLKG